MMRILYKIALILSAFAGFLSSYAWAEENYKGEKVPYSQDRIHGFLISQNTLMSGATGKRYSVRNLMDHDVSTAWVTKYSDKTAEDFLLKISFDKPLYVKSITIWNGYQKSKKLYYANDRVRTLNIEKVLPGGRTYPLQNYAKLDDRLGAQQISLTKGWTQSINLFKTKDIILNVADIFEGKKFDDLCLSEISIEYTSKSNYAPSVTWDALKKLIDNSRERNGSGWDWEGLDEKNYRLFNDLLYYTLSGNPEARKYFDTYTPAGVGQSEAMSNIYKSSVAAELNN